MRRSISIFMFLLGVFAAVWLSAFADDFDDVMRLTPVGYRLGETGDVTAYASSVVAVTPDGTSIVTSKKPVALTAVLNRDYKVVRWQKFDVDPTIRTGADPIEEFGEKSETVSVGLSTNVMWMYVAVVLEYDPVRSVKASRSSFARGTVSVSPEKTSYRKGDVVTLTAEPAEGYSFVRWSDGNADHVRRLTVDDDIDLTACIEPDSSRVSFSAGAGAVLDVTSKRVSYGSAYGELPVPERTGAKFSGWTDDEKRSVTEKTTVNRTADHTLYASWSDLLYEIAWKFTGRGNGKVDGAGTYAYGSQPTLKAVPYEGSDFAGWADGETRNPRRITVLSNALYVAAFDIATYDVTFTYRDAAGNLVTAGPTTVEHGGKVDPPSIPEWPEHTFANWSTEEYGKVTRDLRVEAIYDTVTYSVAFAYRDWQGNSVTTMPQHVTAGGKANPPDRSVVDNWTGNTFKGWAPDYNVIGRDTLCKAIYETNTYTVTFSYCDARGEELQHVEYVRHGEKVSFDYAEGVKNLWTGHVFKNWSCGGQVIADTDAVIATGNMQISAAYEGYARITYATNDGEGEMPMQVYTNYSGDVQLALNAFARTGYLFTGWSTDGSDDPVYDDGDTLSVSDGTAIALTACWKPITYTLKFDGNGGTCKLEPETLTYDQERVIEYNKKNEEQDVERANYKFLFWSKDPVETNEIYKTESIGLFNNVLTVSNLTTVAGSTVVWYAIWKANSQTVTINGEPFTLEYGSQLEKKPADPMPKPGYTFTGEWNTNNNITVSFPITVTGDFNLDPVWTTNTYTVAFHGNGGDGEMEPQAFVYDKWQALTANTFTRTGHTFAGWATNETGTAVYKDKQSVRNLSSDEDAVVDLSATWTANAYTVRFDPGEGKGKAYAQGFTYDEAQALEANRFTAPELMVFDRWTNAVDATTYADCETVSNLTTDGVFVLYATWKDAPSYAVAFDGNGGEGTPYVQDILCGKATALTPNRFARTGYGFAGWAAAEGGGSTVVYTNGAVVTDLAAEGETNDLYAAWTPNRYWVRFDGNGADGGRAMENQAFAYDEAQALSSNAFTRTGYGFAGWAAAESSGSTVDYADGAVVSNLTAEADATNTLWATWRAKSYEIAFDSAGGSAVAPVTNDYGTAVEAPTATRPGYQFAGWYEGDDPFDFSSMPARNVRLTAHWTANAYEVRFNRGEGSGTMENQSFTYDVPQNLAANRFTPPERMVFDCWTNATGDAFADRALVTNLVSEGICDLYVVWTDAPNYAVRFNPNGGAGTPYVQDILCGKATALTPNRFARTGYGFAGWAAAEGGGSTVVYTNGAVVTDLAAEGETNDLYAAWTANRYWVRFERNGADGGTTMAAQVFTYDAAQALSSNAFTRTGYGFAGWAAAESSGSTVDYADGAVVSNLTAEADATNTLWATWRANHYTVVYHGPDGAREEQNFVYDQAQNLKSADTFTPPETWMVFAGWTNAVGDVYAAAKSVSNLTAEANGKFDLYAKWADDSYTVTFDGNGATGGGMEPQVFKHGETKTLEPNEFNRIGHTFEKWTGADGKAYVDKASFTAPATGIVETLHAEWKAIEYTDSFNGLTETFAYGATVTRDTPSSKPGYTFNGWTTNGIDVIDLDPATSTFVQPDHNVAFTSKWEAITYTIAFDGNEATGGTPMSAVEGVKYDVAVDLPSNSFTKAGYEFLGWARSADATEKEYDNGASVTNLTSEGGTTVTFYAVWNELGNSSSIALGVPRDWETKSTPATAWTVIGGPGEGLRCNASESWEGIALEIPFPEAGNVFLTFTRVDASSDYDPVLEFNGDETTYESIEDLTRTSSLRIPSAGILRFRYAPNRGYWTLKVTSWTPDSAQ